MPVPRDARDGFSASAHTPVDDEPLALERARRLLDIVGGVEVVGQCSNGRNALAFIEANPPDVVLLDINMPELDGMRMLEALDDPPAFIFATAYEHHAVRAFKTEVTDYLLKPFFSGLAPACFPQQGFPLLVSPGAEVVDVRLRISFLAINGLYDRAITLSQDSSILHESTSTGSRLSWSATPRWWITSTIARDTSGR